MTPDSNLAMLERIAEALGPLRHSMAFLGGCATGLLITDPAAAPIRATRDVDVIVETPDRSAYFALEKEMTERGFRHDQGAGAPICRWTFGETLLDVMPTDPSVLGFANRWYPEALRTQRTVRLPSGVEIAVVSPPAFLWPPSWRRSWEGAEATTPPATTSRTSSASSTVAAGSWRRSRRRPMTFARISVSSSGGS